MSLIIKFVYKFKKKKDKRKNTLMLIMNKRKLA